MKKMYNKPDLRTEQFDVRDVITASDPEDWVDEVGDLLEQAVNMVNSALGH